MLPPTHAGLPAWLEARTALSEVCKLASVMRGDSAPIIVTFVSNGYEAILNNWLAWVQHSGADITRLVIVTDNRTDHGALAQKGVHIVAVGSINQEPKKGNPQKGLRSR